MTWRTLGQRCTRPICNKGSCTRAPAEPSATKVTVILKDGTQISGTLKHLDDFYVSLDDAAGNYRSIALEKGVTVSVEDKLVFHRQMLDKYTNQQMHDLTAYLVTLK